MSTTATSGEAATRFVEAPKSSVAEWVACFSPLTLPVLSQSAHLLEDFRAHEDDVDAHLLSDAFGADPLMVLKVLAHVAHVRRRPEGSDPETLTAALVMLGITPFFRDFGPQPTVDGVLSGVPGALEGLSAVLRRSRRAGQFAMAFALQRIDHDAIAIHDAALLHDFAEMLVWLRAPALALEVNARLQAQPGLRSAVAQREVLNIELCDLQQALMTSWRLPAILAQIADDHRESLSAQSKTVYLAVRLARHTALDWENPAIGDDVREIADLLHLGIEPTHALLRDIDDSP